MSARKSKILESYPIRGWQASNGAWKAHVPDSSKPRGARLVFASYFADWLVRHKSKVVQPATIQRNFDDYRKFIAGTRLDGMRITAIKRKDIKDFLDGIVNEHHLTRKSLNNAIRNTNIQPEKVREAKTEIFNEQELDTLVEYLYGHYMESRPVATLAILLNLQLGLRVGELCALRKTDIDMERQTIRIDRTERSYRPISLEGGRIVEGKTVHDVTDGRAKKDSNRILDLSDEAIAIIRRALELQKELSIKSDYLFADEKGGHIIRQRVNDCLRFYGKKVSLDAKSSHKIRKTVLSNLFANGFDFEEVMQIAGHRNKSTTLKYYLFSMRLKEDRKARLNQALASNHCKF